MPYLDYFITTDVELAKDGLRQAEKPLLIPDLILGQDNRTWNKKRLEALRLVLCNLVKDNEMAKSLLHFPVHDGGQGDF